MAAFILAITRPFQYLLIDCPRFSLSWRSCRCAPMEAPRTTLTRPATGAQSDGRMAVNNAIYYSCHIFIVFANCLSIPMLMRNFGC
jgi:hypothetical protein